MGQRVLGQVRSKTVNLEVYPDAKWPLGDAFAAYTPVLNRMLIREPLLAPRTPQDPSLVADTATVLHEAQHRLQSPRFLPGPTAIAQDLLLEPWRQIASGVREGARELGAHRSPLRGYNAGWSASVLRSEVEAYAVGHLFQNQLAIARGTQPVPAVPSAAQIARDIAPAYDDTLFRALVIDTLVVPAAAFGAYLGATRLIPDD